MGFGFLSFNGVSKRKKLVTILLLAAIVLAGWVWHIHTNHSLQAKVDNPLTLEEKKSQASTYVSQNLASKNYDAAVQGCINESSNAFYLKDYAGARDALEVCTTKVPNQYLPWYLYDSLALTAQKLNDKTLEKTALTNAIARAQDLNSGTTPADVNRLKTELAAIK